MAFVIFVVLLCVVALHAYAHTYWVKDTVVVATPYVKIYNTHMLVLEGKLDMHICSYK